MLFKFGNKRKPNWHHFRCTKCTTETGAHGNYFKHYKDLPQVMATIYMLMNDYPVSLIKHELGSRAGKIVADQVYSLGKVATKILKDKFRAQSGTWGSEPSSEIQIDEAAVSARKYQRGKRVRIGGTRYSFVYMPALFF